MSDCQIINGDCMDVMGQIRDVDAIVTDPPYGLSFMGNAWDHNVPGPEYWQVALEAIKPGGHLLAFGGTKTWHRLACAIEDAGWEVRDTIMWVYGGGFPKSKNVLKPAWEPVILARRKGPKSLRADECRVPYASESDRLSATPQGRCTSKNSGSIGAEPDAGRGESRVEFKRPEQTGRWPANLIHDGSDEVMEMFPETSSGSRKAGSYKVAGGSGRDGDFGSGKMPAVQGDSGSAARFFYCAKASKKDRGEGNSHPTVKPHELMRYLCRLVCPVGGTVLDPFCGSGSTGKAAAAEGMNFIGIEIDADYCKIAEDRVASA